MKEATVEKWLSAGKSYLLRIDHRGDFATIDSPTESDQISGELKLLIHQTARGRVGVYLSQLGLVGQGIFIKGKESGRLSVGGLGGAGHISFQKEQWVLELDFDAEVLYERIGCELGYGQVAEDVFNAPTEKFRGHINGVITPIEDKEHPSGLALMQGSIHLVYQLGGLGQIRSLSISLEGTPLVPLAGASETGEGSTAANSPCHPSLLVNRRTMRVQPVGFRSNATDANPTGASLNRQINAANYLWGKCCIHFDVQPIHLINDATLKTSSDATAIADSYTDTNANTIEVFFAGHNLANMGGGRCYNGNTALAKIVITDNNVGNDNLLAHELGHALSGLHPGGAQAGWWEGDTDTVLVPSGSGTKPNPDKNTHWNCTRATNPAMTTETTTCCLTHDIPEHYIRDFPEDLGTEPATLPTGRNFYAMSNLWNRLSNSPGGVTPDGQPEHQQPVRYKSDGTLYQNYMFAKVEGIVNLPPRDMTVKFFLKPPGSGGGAANIQLIGSTPVPNTLRPGHSETVSLAWQIPAGTPQHSCMFAVVRSPAEPDQDITSMAFQYVETVVRADNDWVQRNLEVGDYPDGNSNEGQNNKIWTAPILITFPFHEGAEPLPLSLQVDASQAERLVDLAVEVPGREQHKARPGGVARIKLTTSVKSGQNLPLVLNAILPSDAEEGEVFTVDVNPTLGDTTLIGYGFQICISRPQRVLAQTMDIALAAYQDYAELTGSEAADELTWVHQEILDKTPYAPYRFLKWLTGREELFARLIRDLSQKAFPEELDVIAAFERFLKALPDPKDLAALSCYRDAVSRLQMLACIMHQKAHVPQHLRGITKSKNCRL